MTKISRKNNIRDADSELIAAINQGEEKRFTELVSRYQGKLYNFGLRLCRDAQDAEDLVQDTFINVFKYLKNFRYESQFKNWLYKVAAGVCYKKRRKSKFAPERELSLDDFIPPEAEAPEEMPAWAALPIDKVLNDELAEHLNEAIAELPTKYQLVLVLRDIEGFSTSEAAQILSVSESNVKVRLHRARLFLRETLKNYYNHESD
jgi:RNA polymerase sigma-70 factor, ECF subfamily